MCQNQLRTCVSIYTVYLLHESTKPVYKMERSVKYLYYRGVRYTKQLFSINTEKLVNYTYRGVSFVKKLSEKAAISHATKAYRGVAYS
jgi:hypothetical protein